MQKFEEKRKLKKTPVFTWKVLAKTSGLGCKAEPC